MRDLDAYLHPPPEASPRHPGITVIPSLRALADEFESTARRLDAMASAGGFLAIGEQEAKLEGAANVYLRCAAAVRDFADEQEASAE